MYVAMSVYSKKYESQEAQRRSEVGGVMSPNHNNIIDFYSNTSYFKISVDTKEDEYVLTISTVDNPNPFSQTAAYTLLSSIYTTRASSKYAVSKSFESAASLT